MLQKNIEKNTADTIWNIHNEYAICASLKNDMASEENTSQINHVYGTSYNFWRRMHFAGGGDSDKKGIMLLNFIK